MGDNKINKKAMLEDFIQKKDDKAIIKTFSVEEITNLLTYPEAMRLSNRLFFENVWEDDFREYCINLFFYIKKTFPKKWDKDWKNDAYLGNLCSLYYMYDERCSLYKEAYSKVENAPDSLLLLLASCNSAPGTPPMTDEETEQFLIRAVRKKLTYEAAVKMRALSREKSDQQQEAYWNNMMDELERKNIHTETIVPDILK